MKQTAIELTIRQGRQASSEGLGGVADLRFTPPDINISREMAVNVPVVFDTGRLLRASQDPDEYGKDLADMLFSDDVLRREWEKTYAYTQAFANIENTVLRFRLRLDLPFHLLRWETLYNPLTNSPLCFSERILFSRYFDSSDLVPVHIPSKPELNTLIAVSNPRDLEEYGLADVDVAGEHERIKSSLLGISHRILDRASISKIINELRDGCNILYLACHGSRTSEGETYLWLEKDNDGTSDRISGREFVQRIQNLSRPPLLIVLASCQSAGYNSETSGVSVGPLLAGAGVPAVLAMQGHVTMNTIAKLMPVFFEKLQQIGQIDLAIAAARGAVRDRTDYWMPVLFMRMRDGRLWHEPADLQKGPGIEVSRPRIERLRELKQLYDEGLITVEEYESKKQNILAEI